MRRQFLRIVAAGVASCVLFPISAVAGPPYVTPDRDQVVNVKIRG